MYRISSIAEGGWFWTRWSATGQAPTAVGLDKAYHAVEWAYDELLRVHDELSARP